MVSIVESLRRLLRPITSIFETGDTTDERQFLFEAPEEGEELETFEFRKKFVSGLFYCGGRKRQFFGLTFEQNSTVRESELLEAIEDRTDRTCSEIRDNFGYADDFVSRDQVRTGAIWPDIEVGEL